MKLNKYRGFEVALILVDGKLVEQDIEDWDIEDRVGPLYE
jgi:hypothetical protein